MKGFTLIEVIIAVGLFSVVMTIALSVILSVVANNKKTHAVNSVVNNLNFAIDSMVRDIKTGKGYRCDKNLTGSPADATCGTSLADHNVITLVSTISGREGGNTVMYEFVPESGSGTSFEPGRIDKTVCDDQYGTRCDTGTITSPEITIKDMVFNVSPGVSLTIPHTQPSVFLLIHGTSAVDPTSASDFTIQTLISQRILNI